jgi:hypothetical protein
LLAIRGPAKRYTELQDGGHRWLAVPLCDLRLVGISRELNGGWGPVRADKDTLERWIKDRKWPEPSFVFGDKAYLSSYFDGEKFVQATRLDIKQIGYLDVGGDLYSWLLESVEALA